MKSYISPIILAFIIAGCLEGGGDSNPTAVTSQQSTDTGAIKGPDKLFNKIFS